MASGINPLKTVYSVNLGNIGDKSAKITNALANNVNPNISTFHAIFGRQLNSNSTRGNSIVENMGLSSSLLSTALTATSSLINQLEDMKNDLLGLSDASPALLAIGQSTYQDKVASVIAFIRDASFGDKKLFDGSLASGAPAHSGVPANHSPLQIQNGLNSYIIRALPRLLAGDGTVVDNPNTPGQFQPLFPVINDYFVPENTAANGIKTAINAGVVNNIGDVIFAVGTVVASDMRTFVTALDTAVDNEKAVVNVANGGGVIATTKTEIDNVADAAAAYLTAVHTHFITTTPTIITAAEIDKARDDIKAVYNNAAAVNSGNVRKNARDLNVAALYPAGANSVLRSVYDSIATSVKQTGNAMFTINGTGNVPLAGAALKAANNASIDSMMATTRTITFDAGNVETTDGRNRVTLLLNNAINILDVIGAQLTGDQDSLEVGKAAVKQQIIALTNAANTILSADYEKLVPELTELRRLVTILSMAFGIEETMLNTVIDKLEGLSR